MQIPAFTADAAVYRSSNPYHTAVGAGWEGGIAAPQVGLELLLPVPQPACLPPCPPEGGGSQTCCVWVRQFLGGGFVRHCWTVQCPDRCTTNCYRSNPPDSCALNLCLCNCDELCTPVCCADQSNANIHGGVCPPDPSCPSPCGWLRSGT